MKNIDSLSPGSQRRNANNGFSAHNGKNYRAPEKESTRVFTQRDVYLTPRTMREMANKEK